MTNTIFQKFTPDGTLHEMRLGATGRTEYTRTTITARYCSTGKYCRTIAEAEQVCRDALIHDECDRAWVYVHTQGPDKPFDLSGRLFPQSWKYWPVELTPAELAQREQVRHRRRRRSQLRALLAQKWRVRG